MLSIGDGITMRGFWSGSIDEPILYSGFNISPIICFSTGRPFFAFFACCLAHFS